MKGLKIVMHAFQMVWNNLKEALQISTVPLVVVGFAAYALLPSFSLDFSDPELVGQAWQPFLLVWVGWLAATTWIFVAWHRYVLLEEYPKGWIPTFRLVQVLSYLGYGIVIGCIAGLALLPGLIFALVSPALGSLFIFIGVVAAILIFYRLVPMLPAVAIGRRMTLSEAWGATEGANTTIVSIVLILFAIQLVLQLAFETLAAIAPVLEFLASLGFTLFLGLVNVSILTTFYGHYVEGRSID
ncbi:hypothetical protein [Roseovarius sp. EL26]|uniref:hypothetical protein n=1 Tax=Roseovarius sp. EL26 TaxID=2126672 RepID=UPI000EA0037A|nr:hypothetical protein [Roseovarius sp. EL26]